MTSNLKALGLAGGSYLDRVPEVQRRIIMSIESEEGKGKTTLALDAPAPIAYLCGDKNSDGPLQLAASQKEIVPSFYDFQIPSEDATEDEISKAARPIRNQLMKDFDLALNSKVRTVVVETGGWLMWLLRMARFGTVKVFPTVRHSETNAQFQRLLDKARASDKNVIWTHRLRDEREDKLIKGKLESVKTGRLETVQYGQMDYEMQCIIRLRSDAPLGFGMPLVGEVRKCTLNSELVGEEFSTADKVSPLRFATIASRVFGTSAKEWR